MRTREMLSMLVLMATATTIVHGFGQRVISRKSSPIRLGYQQFEDSDSHEASAASLGSWISNFAASILPSNAPKDDFDKYVDFLGHRYSRLHFGEQKQVPENLFGLVDVQQKHKAKQSIMSFNFAEASSMALDIPIPEATAKKVSQVIYSKEQQPATILGQVATFMWKQVLLVRMYINYSIHKAQAAIAAGLSAILSPLSRDTARRIQKTVTLAVACALIMYKPLKGVTFAALSLSKDA